MEIIEIRAVIKYLKIKGLSRQEAYADLVSSLGDDAPSYATVKKWYAEFTRGRTSTEDADRPGRPVEVSTPENVNNVHQHVLKDRRVTIQQISQSLNISYGSVQSILTDKLKMSKVSARWVPRQLTPDQLHFRVSACRENLARWQLNPCDFLERMVTVDETWVHHFDPETKRQSMQWKHFDSPPPRKFRAIPSAGKVMATIFWDSEGVILTDFLEKGATINKEYYSDELKRLREEIKKKRRGKLSRGILLLQDNAPAHTAQLSVATANKCGFEILRHPPYSPDLAPSDFYLFPLMKETLRGKKFDNNTAVVNAVESFLETQKSEFYKIGLLKLEKRWTKCIELNGDYVEK